MAVGLLMFVLVSVCFAPTPPPPPHPPPPATPTPLRCIDLTDQDDDGDDGDDGNGEDELGGAICELADDEVPSPKMLLALPGRRVLPTILLMPSVLSLLRRSVRRRPVRRSVRNCVVRPRSYPARYRRDRRRLRAILRRRGPAALAERLWRNVSVRLCLLRERARFAKFGAGPKTGRFFFGCAWYVDQGHRGCGSFRGAPNPAVDHIPVDRRADLQRLRASSASPTSTVRIHWTVRDIAETGSLSLSLLWSCRWLCSASRDRP